jgi:hypothetical protein
MESRPAPLEILSSNRSLSAYASLEYEITDSDSVSTQGTEPFSETVTASVSSDFAMNTASAHQTSSFTPSGFNAAGQVHDEILAGDYAFVGYAEAKSTFDVAFRLSEASNYAVYGYIWPRYSTWGDVTLTVTFSGPEGVILFDQLHNWTQNPHPFQLSGVLQAGDYTLSISAFCLASVYAHEAYLSGSYNLHLTMDPTSVPSDGVREDVLRAFPNPFTSSSRIYVPGNARGIRIYDTAGRIVRRFEGSAVHDWDGRDENGKVMPAGVYFIRLVDERAGTGLKLVRIR